MASPSPPSSVPQGATPAGIMGNTVGPAREMTAARENGKKGYQAWAQRVAWLFFIIAVIAGGYAIFRPSQQTGTSTERTAAAPGRINPGVQAPQLPVLDRINVSVSSSTEWSQEVRPPPGGCYDSSSDPRVEISFLGIDGRWSSAQQGRVSVARRFKLRQQQGSPVIIEVIRWPHPISNGRCGP